MSKKQGDALLEALFPTGEPVVRKSKEELLQQLEVCASHLREQTEKALSALTKKERLVLALRFAGGSPEDERVRALLCETEPHENDDGVKP